MDGRCGTALGTDWQDRTGQDRTGQALGTDRGPLEEGWKVWYSIRDRHLGLTGRTGQDRTGQDRTGQDRTGLC